MIDRDSRFFVLDSNIFIEAHRRYYSFDICPGFWDALTYYCFENKLFSIDRVLEELQGKDLLSEWAKNTAHNLFVSTREEAIYTRYAEIMTWVNRQEFSERAKAEFARGADGWLVAYVLVHGGLLVTHEKPVIQVKNRVPIPNVCNHFNVEYLNTFSMLRELEIVFRWAPAVT